MSEYVLSATLDWLADSWLDNVLEKRRQCFVFLLREDAGGSDHDENNAGRLNVSIVHSVLANSWTGKYCRLRVAQLGECDL